MPHVFERHLGKFAAGVKQLMTLPEPFPIVAIGASAGGIAALQGLFAAMPAQPSFACVVIMHLNPDWESRLHEILARHARMPVVVAADGMLVEVNSIYVLPPGPAFTISGGRLALRQVVSGVRDRKPIDTFFSDLAIDQGELAVGIVLSGGDGDGTLGIKAIKEHGGLTLAQTPDGHGPQHPSMPESAISTGLVDFALPVDQMGQRLVEFARRPSMPSDTLLVGPADEDGGESLRQQICAILRNQLGHDFAGYKTPTFMRRVQRRMRVHQIETLDGYLALLRQDTAEASALFRDLLISVTNFFRDSDAFDSLASDVIPRLFEGRGASDTIRVWVPGCATGEEVYSIAILLREHMATLSAAPQVQVFATDIDERALAVARTGRYPAALLDSVSPERQAAFFTAEDGGYRVSKLIRDLCVFSPHSLLRDPPFSRIDLISCRNLLIYFGMAMQDQVIPLFHYALRPDGYLFLGASESIGQHGALFTPLDPKQRIFRKRVSMLDDIKLPLTMVGRLSAGPSNQHQVHGPTLTPNMLRQSAEAQMLDEFGPPFVVVNRDGDIVHYSSRTGRYLEAAVGQPTRQLVPLARRGLRLELRMMLHEAAETGRDVMRDGLLMQGDDDRLQTVRLAIAPLRQSDSREKLFLVVFQDLGTSSDRDEAMPRSRAGEEDATRELERELHDTQERLQALVEEYETALEELKSSNEELVSVNEELQSSNEELEASKEELQSVNEELLTVNAELNAKLEALDHANSDLHNLFESTEIAAVFLDRDLVIRSFTPAIAAIFKILPVDRGRPITDLSSVYALPGLTGDIKEVFAGGAVIERRIERERPAKTYLMRISPYHDSKRELQGVVLTFVDITSLVTHEAHQQMLVGEVQHRTRNLLAVVQSMAKQALQKGGSLTDFAMRLSALGRVQSLISQSSTEAVDLGEIVRLELEAHGAADAGHVRVDGPPVTLRLDQVQTLALALHELATNAVKYGALRPDNGQLAISWSVATRSRDTLRDLTLEWRESGVAMPSDTSRRGNGRKLIEQALPFTLRAKTNLSFGTDGVMARIEVPLTA
jgi:two-component system CheB/CheR fusion protein